MNHKDPSQRKSKQMRSFSDELKLTIVVFLAFRRRILPVSSRCTTDSKNFQCLRFSPQSAVTVFINKNVINCTGRFQSVSNHWEGKTTLGTWIPAYKPSCDPTKHHAGYPTSCFYYQFRAMRTFEFPRHNYLPEIRTGVNYKRAFARFQVFAQKVSSRFVLYRPSLIDCKCVNVFLN